jgi:hypothetical protein
VPIALLIAVALRFVVRSFPVIAALVALLLYLNYDSAPASDNPHAASPRLIESFAIMQRRNSNLMEFGRRFARQEAPQKLLVGYWAIPYSEYAVLARADRFTRKVIKAAGVWELEVWSKGNPTPTLVRIRYGPQPVPEYQERAKWFIFNPERGHPL